MAEIVRVNFKLYDAVALINLRYDNQSYPAGAELGIRETDIAELADERHYVEMKERPEQEQESTTPPPKQEEQKQEQQQEEQKTEEEGSNQKEGE